MKNSTPPLDFKMWHKNENLIVIEKNTFMPQFHGNSDMAFNQELTKDSLRVRAKKFA